MLEHWMMCRNIPAAQIAAPPGFPLRFKLIRDRKLIFLYTTKAKDNMIKTEQVSLLVGRNVELVCFAQYAIYIHLDLGALLILEAGFDHVNGETRNVHHVTFPIKESSLMRIVECSVSSASVDTNGDLDLKISNGDAIHVSKQLEYESYRLRIGVDEFII